MVPVDSSRRFSCPALLQVTCFESGVAIRLSGLSPSMDLLSEDSTSNQLVNSSLCRPYNPESHEMTRVGMFRFRSALTPNRGFFCLLEVLEMVHFPPFRCSQRMYLLGHYLGFCPGGFPIRKSPVSTPVCGTASPKLIAACHVLHRLFLQGIHRAP